LPKGCGVASRPPMVGILLSAVRSVRGRTRADGWSAARNVVPSPGGKLVRGGRGQAIRAEAITGSYVGFSSLFACLDLLSAETVTSCCSEPIVVQAAFPRGQESTASRPVLPDSARLQSSHREPNVAKVAVSRIARLDRFHRLANEPVGGV